MDNRQKINALADKLEILDPCSQEWDEVYAEYKKLCAIEQERYKQENIGALKAFYDEHIAGKEWSQIDAEAWDWYSDFHKDVFGYRPRSLSFGEYVPA